MGLFNNHQDDNTPTDSHSCPIHSLDENATQHIVGNFDFYHVNMIISGACSLIAIVIMLIFKQMHATHLSNPTEQVKIMRIATLITMFSIISFLSVAFPKAYVYIHPWLGFVEAFAIGSFFLLLCDFISPNDDQRDIYIAAKRHNGAKWFRSRWIMIFQLPIVSFVVAVGTDITAAAGIYCEWKSSPKFAKAYLGALGAISLTLAMLAILQFYALLKAELAKHRPLLKLIAFKAIVSLTFFQAILFWILTDTGALKESATLTYADLHIGLPNMILCIEMVPLSLFFFWAYPWGVYLVGKGGFDTKVALTNPYQGGPFGIWAWLQMLNPSDTFKAIIFIFKPYESSKLEPMEDQLEMESQPLNNHGHTRL
uniref:Uncharacterized protein n=1 Tax=Bionectria ochroleuca TaxID=29856 RepID=A0A8H7K6X7_BIOOC